MPDRRKTIIASSIEPSGVTWLLNCLLYLDILCYRGGTSKSTWNFNDGEFSLRPEHEELNRWLPIISDRSSFTFSSPVECEWTHNMPTQGESYEKVILFTRDPRGSILSRYKRDFKHTSIEKFVRLLDPQTLLTVPDQLNHFYLSWLEQTNTLVLKFEDYKVNPVQTLRKAIIFLDLNFSEQELKNACENSTFEKAAEIEKKYISGHGLPAQRVMNRAGSMHEWIEDAEMKLIKGIIDKACQESLFRLNYLEKRIAGFSEENFFSRSVLSSINIQEVIFQQHYTKEDKQKIIRGLSRHSLLTYRRRQLLASISRILDVLLFLDESLKVNYMRLKTLFAPK